MKKSISGKNSQTGKLRQSPIVWEIFSVIEGIPGTQAWVEYHADTETVYIKFEGQSKMVIAAQMGEIIS